VGGSDAGVVDQDIDPAERLHCRVHQSQALLRDADVGGDRQCFAAGGFDERRGLGQPVDAARAQYDVRTGLGERLGE
jgi:hypothetical protein